MSEPRFMPVIEVQDYEVTATETIYMPHKGTNQVLQVIKKTILNKVLYSATSEELAMFDAMTEIKKIGQVVMPNLKVTARPFPG